MSFFSVTFRSTELSARLTGSRARLYRLAYSWCHNAALAEDLVQETLYKALKKSDQVRDMDVLEGWLFKIMTNCWYDHLRPSSSPRKVWTSK